MTKVGVAPSGPGAGGKGPRKIHKTASRSASLQNAEEIKFYNFRGGGRKGGGSGREGRLISPLRVRCWVVQHNPKLKKLISPAEINFTIFGVEADGEVT